MIGQSLLEYVFIRICILLLRSVAAASIVYLLFCTILRKVLFSPWLLAYAAIEASFYLFVYLPRSRFLSKPSGMIPKQLERSEREALFHKCATQFRDHTYPIGWFLSSDIKRQNVYEWILWALFTCDLQDSKPEWQDEIDGYINIIEERLEKKFEDGRSDATKSMRLAFDRIRMNHRPLVWYLIVCTVDHLTALSLMFAGFRHYNPRRWFQVFPPRIFTLFSRRSAADLSYWYRPHRSKDKDPIVFLHGIGIGLWPYVGFFKDITRADPDVGILLIEFLPISMHMTPSPIPPRALLLQQLSTVLDSFDIHRSILAAHSYGTTIGAQDLPQVNSLVLIDPIPILLHLPDVAFNFLYRKPRQANEWQLWYFAGRDPDIARTLWRCFFWQDCVLWREDLFDQQKLKNVGISLSGKDQVVRSESVWRYLTKRDDSLDRNESWTSKDAGGDEDGRDTTGSQAHVEVLYHHDLDHATVFDGKEKRRGLLDLVLRFSQSSPRY